MSPDLRRTPLLLLAVVGLLGLVLCPSAQAEDSWQNVERIVAIGDVHGDYEQFVELLRQSGLVDENEDWTGGTAHLVQTGDVPDRGPDTRKIMDLLMKLEKQAKKSDGFVHALIGNHEAMNVYGDVRYVTVEEFASFATPRSERLRERAYEQHVKQVKDSRPREQWPDFDGSHREEWEKEHPPGYFEHREAFSPSGKYGRWITGHNVIIQINDILFVHGGIGPAYADSSVREINRKARETFRNLSKLKNSVLVADDGPLWYRGFANESAEEEASHVSKVLEHFGANHIVVGHTPTIGTVIPRFNGQVYLIDVGLSAAYGGRLACLLIETGQFYALHRGEKLALPTDSGAGLLRYLQKAAALDPEPSPLQPVIEKLENALQAPAAGN